MDGRPGSFATGVFRALPSDTAPRKIQKRNRPPVSCLLCRTRKVKCDRQQPCERCVKSGEASFCEYAPRAPRKPKPSSHDPAGRPLSSSASAPDHGHAPGSGAGSGVGTGHYRGGSGGGGNVVGTDAAARPLLQMRLQKLEDLVHGLVQAPPPPPAPATGLPHAGSGSGTAGGPGAGLPVAMNTPRSLDHQPTDSESRSSDYGSPPSSHIPGPYGAGQNATRFGENTFVGPSHWASILESIQDIRGIIAAESDDTLRSPSPPPQHHVSSTSDILFSSSSITLEQAVSQLPPKHRTDQLILLYFRSKLAAASYIHTTKFQREYDAFWERPASASLLWISCLASMLCTASSISVGNGNAVSESDPAHPAKLAVLGKNCLVAGNYLSGRPYAIEALMLHGMTEKARTNEIDLSLWAKFGVLARLAQRMGYHRDPKYIANVTAFEGEMRRRVWFFIEVFDVIFSFQLGLPPIIHSDECDTEAPSNLYDSDFDEHTAVLPPPRPATEPTATLYLSCKFKLCRLLREVIRINSCIRGPTYDQVLALGDSIHSYRAQIPPPLQIRPVKSYSFTDQSADIVHRLLLEMMYLRSLCVLHRPYLSREKGSPRYEVSRTTCREAALRMLDLHAEYEAESRPGGRLSDEKYILNNLGGHDFLMASMILCLDLTEKLPITPSERSRIMTALSTSYKMWSERKAASKEAAHATRVVGAILRKLSMQDISAPQPQGPQQSSTTNGSPAMSGPLVNLSRPSATTVDNRTSSPLSHPTTAATTTGSPSSSSHAIPRDGSLASLLNNDTTTTTQQSALITPPLSTSPAIMAHGNNSTPYPTATSGSGTYDQRPAGSGTATGTGPGNGSAFFLHGSYPAIMDLSHVDFGDPGLLPLDDVLSNPSLVDWAFIDQILLDNPEGGFRALQ
ncbi:fungal-specific transcription factor domain-containing protein [Microdochium trichocladiopsis]|uniref:Fungal-specific transcription factor domain-containing protein n=1 Tax=Microdochium trichocladiopsis TaxID=1682393 RepID=A0A9P8Y052_9PEZI|nr:fungal-specific transcription factor domain-containing protein [Microdochium trichocladiopsis]KAH7026298.1 fungal-specific transcription factor domain-containing protein [Microdochium trichocladiopsis]